MDNTKIEWCDATLSLWWGCTKVSDGCKLCYAENLADGRFGRNNWGPKGKRQEVKSWRAELNKISKRGLAEGRRLRVFCQSMSDTFEGPETCGGLDSENWKLMERLRANLFYEVPRHPHLDFLLLTKRPENACRLMADSYEIRVSGTAGYDDGRTELYLPKNLWIGTSVEDQATAIERIPHLSRIPAAVRYLSCEPLIGMVDLTDIQITKDGVTMNALTGVSEGIRYLPEIHWVIVGGESGRNARPMRPTWAQSLRDQCVAAGVPFFFKQWGEWAPLNGTGRPHPDDDETELPWTWVSPDGQTKQSSDGYSDSLMVRVGKKAAGRLLDGREWSQFPGGEG